LKDIQEEFNASGYKAISIQCDVSDESQVKNAISQAVSTFGKLDAAYNNAGIILPPISTAEISMTK
jgi:NAD(P)-dependent dehydrogenase (short-subunit alcohol dehydrogenase family)